MATTTKKRSTKSAGTKTKTAKAAPAKKKSSKAASAKTKTTKAKGDRLSAIDAAAKLLAEVKKPMTTKEMVAAMEGKDYWKSPGGKTPHATLYSAILREILHRGRNRAS